jgi:hypothetical protein
MAAPISSYASGVTTNIAICTLVCPLPWGGLKGPYPPNTQLSANVLDFASFDLAAGSSGVGTVVTFNQLGLDSYPGNLVWRPLNTGGTTSTPFSITLASSTGYGGQLAGPFLGLQMVVSGVVGNGVAYARISATIRTS